MAAVNPYTPAQDRIIHVTEVDFNSRTSVFRPVHVVQYDNQLPILEVTLHNNGQDYVLPSGAYSNIRFRKKDSKVVLNPALGCSQDRKKLYFEITQQMAMDSGEFHPIIEVILGSNQVAGSSSIHVIVDRNPIQYGDVESTDEMKTLESYVSDAEASKNAAAASASAAKNSQTAAAASQTAAKTSETAAKNSQTAAKASEDAALASKNAAATSQSEAKKSQTAAETSASEALASQNAAKDSETKAAASQKAAATSEANALSSKNAAATSQSEAKKSETAAATSASNASKSATLAQSSQTAAEQSATAASGSASTAKTYADAAKTSADAAKTCETNAEKSATEAKDAATLAQSIAQGQKGYYDTPEKLKTANPIGEKGDWAIVGSTDTIWVWDSDTSAWKDSHQATDLSNYYTKAQTDTKLAAKQDKLVDSAYVKSVNSRTGAVVLSKDDVELSNVDNTRDSAKNVLSATKLTTPRSLKTNLGSTAAVTFDGSADQNSIPVTGTLPVGNGGTGVQTIEDLRQITNNYPILTGTDLRDLVILAYDGTKNYCTRVVSLNYGPRAFAHIFRSNENYGSAMVYYNYGKNVAIMSLSSGVWSALTQIYPSTHATSADSATTAGNVSGVVAVAHGGTGVTAITGASGLLHALFDNDLPSAEYVPVFTTNWGDGGYMELSKLKTALGIGASSPLLRANANFNTLGSGFYGYTSESAIGDANAPNSGVLLCLRRDDESAAQIALGTLGGNPTMSIRKQYRGTWSGWAKVTIGTPTSTSDEGQPGPEIFSPDAGDQLHADTETRSEE